MNRTVVVSTTLRWCEGCATEYPDDGYPCPTCDLYPPTPSPEPDEEESQE